MCWEKVILDPHYGWRAHSPKFDKYIHEWVYGSSDTTYQDIKDEDIFTGLFYYEDGWWYGLGTVYWRNGNKRAEGLFDNGRNKGYYKQFYSSGSVEWEGSYGDRWMLNGKFVELAATPFSLNILFALLIAFTDISVTVTSTLKNSLTQLPK